jgi:hypothetical protein
MHAMTDFLSSLALLLFGGLLGYGVFIVMLFVEMQKGDF